MQKEEEVHLQQGDQSLYKDYQQPISKQHQDYQQSNDDLQNKKAIKNNILNSVNSKGKKTSVLINIDKQVVYLFMLSIDKLSNPTTHNSSKNHLAQSQQAHIEKLVTISKQDIKELVQNKLKPIHYSQLNQFRNVIRSTLNKIYLQRQNQLLEQEGKKSQEKQEKQNTNIQNSNFQQTTLKIVSETVNAYIYLNMALRESSVSSPVQQGFYKEYAALWVKLRNSILIENKTATQEVKNFQSNSKFINSFKDQMTDLWLDIPFQLIEIHFNNFLILQNFRQIPEKKILKQLTSLIVDNKIQQCCKYYLLYIGKATQQSQQGNKSSSTKQHQFSQGLKEFQQKILIPKITKSDHIFSSHVLSLLQSHPNLKNNILNSKQLSPAVGVRVIDQLKQDGRNYHNIHMHILKQHYKSIIYDHKTWYMVEDKLSFNKKFIQWYAEDLIKVNKEKTEQTEQNSNQNYKLKGILREIQQDQSIQSIQQLKLSILKRNQIHQQKGQNNENDQNNFRYIQNPLYEKDQFQCAEIVIDSIKGKSQTQIYWKKQQYLRYEQYNVTEKQLKWVDQIDEKFYEMSKDLLSSELVGFDTQFRCTSTKYEQQGVSVIQFSTERSHYLIDFLKLEHEKQFNEFIINILCNPKISKIGHTISSDIRYLRLTLQVPQDKNIEAFIDVAHIFRTLHPGEKFSSLAYLSEKYLGKKLSKYQQRSNWNRRPLKKTQIHYAALDAFSCLLIYKKMQEQKNGDFNTFQYLKATSNLQEENTLEMQNNAVSQPKIQNTLIGQGDVYRLEKIVYHKKYEKFLKTQQPKFLIDNMLKKLSSVMRNCGLDAQYISVKDYNLACQMAQKQERIILTRDSKFFQRKDNRIPIYLISERNDSEKMFEEIVEFFKIDLSLFSTLSRCVKCNGSELITIPAQEARQQLNFKYSEKQQEFWRCQRCKQIYWEGGQFQKAQAKYEKLKN